jgi:exonuclease III
MLFIWIPFPTPQSLMDNRSSSTNREWKVLCWNIKGINSSVKWLSLRNKICGSMCDIVCLQETKCEFFDHTYIKSFCPPTFDCFEYVASKGNTGGIITIWKSSRFSGHTLFKNHFSLKIELTSTFFGSKWILSNIYAPCTPEGRQDFRSWFNEIDMPIDQEWLLVGDFNMYIRQSDRNRNGGNIQNILDFNNAISNLRLKELKLFGNKYRWANKQKSPLLERLTGF